MKLLKKEIITIVALMVVAVIGTYVVNASTGKTVIEKPIVEKMVVPEKDDSILLAGDYDCNNCAATRDAAITECDKKTTAAAKQSCIENANKAYSKCLSPTACNDES